MSEQQQPEQSALDSTPETPVTPSAEEMPLTEQDKIRFSANIGQMKRRTEQMIDGFNERMETMREYHENAPLGGGQTAEGKMQFNPESGKLEKTYITPLGNRYTSKGLADMESFRYRQAADMSVNGQLRRAMLKLAELQEKREASAKRVHEQWEEDTKKNTAPLGFLLAADTLCSSSDERQGKQLPWMSPFVKRRNLSKTLKSRKTVSKASMLAFGVVSVVWQEISALGISA